MQKRKLCSFLVLSRAAAAAAAAASVVSDSVRPHRWQPTRLPHPWDSPGRNTGVGCHFLLQCMKVKRESEVSQSCPILSDPTDCSLPGSSAHGIFRARVLEWLPLPSPKESADNVLCGSLDRRGVWGRMDTLYVWLSPFAVHQ